MAWLPSHQSLRDHPKTKRLRRTLNIAKPQAIGHLHLLWWWALEYAPTGDLSRFEAADLADAAEWDGDPEAFRTALEQAGFLDDDGALHDWHEYGGKLQTARVQNRKRQAKHRAKVDSLAPRNGRVTRDRDVTNGARVDESREEKKRELGAVAPSGASFAREANAAAPLLPPTDSLFEENGRAPVSDDWRPNTHGIHFAEEHSWNRERIDREVAEFIESHQSDDHERTDWQAAWRAWVKAREQNGWGDARTGIESDFFPDAETLQWTDEQGWDKARVRREVPKFIEYNQRRGKQYTNWNSVWTRWVERDLEKEQERDERSHRRAVALDPRKPQI